LGFRRRLIELMLAGSLFAGCNNPCSTSPDPCCTTPTTTYCMGAQACVDAPTLACCQMYYPGGSFSIYQACIGILDGGVPDGGDGG
jgi:hypothetical protein